MDNLKKIKLNSEPEEDIENIGTEEEMPAMPPKKNNMKMMLPLFILVGIVLGIGTGYFVAQKRLLMAGGQVGTPAGLAQNPTSAGAVKAGDTFGTNDTSTFKDQAEGVLQAGGIDGEGSHHLERGDNKSQWVYLTSSVVDLDMFVGDRVTIWGQTNQGKKAGWLMDVGKLKVQEVGTAPTGTGTAGQPE